MGRPYCYIINHTIMIYTRGTFELYLIVKYNLTYVYAIRDVPLPSPSLMSKYRELTTSAPSTPFYVVAAHGGAGYYPPSSDSSIRCSLRAALSSALATFSQGATGISTSSADDHTSYSPGTSSSSALDTATKLIIALEDDPDFNAGYGSNLTFDGDVECDAALMNSSSSDGILDSDSDASFEFGGVGAVRGVRNPVLLARHVLDGRGRGGRAPLLLMGRVPPLLLAGEGAVRFAREVGVHVVREPEEMVAPRARQEWCVWKGRWEQEVRRRHGAAGDAAGTAAAFAGVDAADSLCARQDTVGAVVLVGDARDVQVSAGVSRCVTVT
jgi:taspase, threonine aspartase, 1